MVRLISQMIFSPVSRCAASLAMFSLAFAQQQPKAQPSANWGNINGNIQNQTDLQDQFAATRALIPTAYQQIVNMWAAGCSGFLKSDGTCGTPAAANASWGSISGDIQQQTDLQNQLAAKQPTLTSWADVVKLWPNCTGYLKSDGTCAPLATGTEHYTALTWDHATGNVQYNVYKSINPCSTASGFQKIAQVSAMNYHDTDVTPGVTSCYYVTAFDGTQESAPSNKAEGTTPAARKRHWWQRKLHA